MITPELQAIQTLQGHQPVSIAVHGARSPLSPVVSSAAHGQHHGIKDVGLCRLECVLDVRRGYVRDVDGRVKAAGLGRRRSGFLSEDTALELPLLLARVPLVFLCCRHGGGGLRDFGRHVETRRDETRSIRVVDEGRG